MTVGVVSFVVKNSTTAAPEVAFSTLHALQTSSEVHISTSKFHKNGTPHKHIKLNNLSGILVMVLQKLVGAS